MSKEITTLLGQDSEFEGNLSFEGTLRIDGRFKGEIKSEGTLALGPTADVQGEVQVRICVIEGNFSGNLTAMESVEIRAPAKVKGTVATPELQVERGVLLDGKCSMEGFETNGADPLIKAKKKTKKTDNDKNQKDDSLPSAKDNGS